MTAPIKLTSTINNIWIQVPTELLPMFQKLVNKACNCWPDAPPEIKIFADQITSGTVYQDYYQQDSSQKQRPDTLSWEIGDLPDHHRV